MTFKYYTSVTDLIDSYNEFNKLNNETTYYTSDKVMEQKLIHAYELGFKHATEEEQPDPAEFDTDWETQNES